MMHKAISVFLHRYIRQLVSLFAFCGEKIEAKDNKTGWQNLTLIPGLLGQIHSNGKKCLRLCSSEAEPEARIWKYYFFIFTFSFLGPYPCHMEVPRLEVELELQLPA